MNNFRKLVTFVKKKVAHILSNIVEVLKGLKVRSNVLTHLAWLSVPVLIPSFWGLFTSTDWFVKIFCAIIIIAYIAYNFWKYDYWAKTDPDRLHTEKFYLDKRKLEWMVGRQDEPPRLSDASEPIVPPPLLSRGDDSKK